MNAKTLEQVYHQMCTRRDAISQHFLADQSLKSSDPTSYERYRKELRDINKRLRIIRQCIPANPILALDKAVFTKATTSFLQQVTTF
ncbi:hypothetical protein IC229_01155 [Spirosoma sp. BT702]|uniref:Uncharacterized protein n=1 Tax=Spirosoma profusum TaxID=2771354 RepID=A0A927APX1_9BACT|nr:hypothetical protein [Spirosoma profusum]MBD2699223.1 hypothetical protein [Spirosoma profusum]